MFNTNDLDELFKIASAVVDNNNIIKELEANKELTYKVTHDGKTYQVSHKVVKDILNVVNPVYTEELIVKACELAERIAKYQCNNNVNLWIPQEQTDDFACGVTLTWNIGEFYNVEVAKGEVVSAKYWNETYKDSSVVVFYEGGVSRYFATLDKLPVGATHFCLVEVKGGQPK